MRVISTGNIYKVYDDSLRTYERFPAQAYSVRFSKLDGFYLEKHNDISINEEKIYGAHLHKVNKVFNSFQKFERSLGVILSGDKGIGKSLFAKLLSIKAVESGIPLIIVDSYIPGIAAYLESIDQEVMVLFDEFDKTFGERDKSDGDTDAQTSMLSLFDGVAGGKKLFVITCNYIYKLNEFIVNRPGRFHYHFRFDYPKSTEICSYLQDKLSPEYYCEIDKVITFAMRVPLNYDCLRAIAFEINAGETFGDAIQDLNIVNINQPYYTVTLHYQNGVVAREKSINIDMFSSEEKIVCLEDERGYNYVDVTFHPSDSVYDESIGTNVISADKIIVNYYEENEECKELASKVKNSGIKYLTITRRPDKRLHYLV